MATILFYIFALMSVGSAALIVVFRDIVRVAVALFFALIGVAGLYLLLDAEFLAAVQLVVYVGGVLVIILFGVMLTNKKSFRAHVVGPREVAIALILGSVMLGSMAAILIRAPFVQDIADSHPAQYPMALLGEALLGRFLAAFELVSVLLLVVMIGAAYLAKGRKRNRAAAADAAGEAQ